MSLNTSVKTVNTMNVLACELLVSVKEITKDLTSNVKALNSVGNKHDELKKTV